MAEDKLDLIVHPVRTRIMVALMGRQLTTSKLAEALPNVPKPSLYRQMRKLAEAGLIEVAEEIQVRGAMERVYKIAEGGGELTRRDVMTKEAHVRAFMGFLSMLGSSFEAFVNHPEFDPQRDMAYSLAEPLVVSDEEFRELLRGIREKIEPFTSVPRAPGKRRRVLSIIAIPDEPSPKAAGSRKVKEHNK